MTRRLSRDRWKPASVPEFNSQFKKLIRRNNALEARFKSKMHQILSDPYIGDLKSHNLKGVRGTHVDPYVLIYKIFEDQKTVVFIYVDHHDVAYKKAPKILAKFEEADNR